MSDIARIIGAVDGAAQRMAAGQAIVELGASVDAIGRDVPESLRSLMATNIVSTRGLEGGTATGRRIALDQVLDGGRGVATRDALDGMLALVDRMGEFAKVSGDDVIVARLEGAAHELRWQRSLVDDLVRRAQGQPPVATSWHFPGGSTVLSPRERELDQLWNGNLLELAGRRALDHVRGAALLAEGLPARIADERALAGEFTEASAEAAQRMTVGDRGGAIGVLADRAAQLARSGMRAHGEIGVTGARFEDQVLRIDVNQLHGAHARAGTSVDAARQLLSRARELASDGGDAFMEVSIGLDQAIGRLDEASRAIAGRDSLVARATVAGEPYARIVAAAPRQLRWNGHRGVYEKRVEPQLQLLDTTGGIAHADFGIEWETTRAMERAARGGTFLRRSDPLEDAQRALTLIFGDHVAAADGIEHLGDLARLADRGVEPGVHALSAAETLARIEARYGSPDALQAAARQVQA